MKFGKQFLVTSLAAIALLSSAVLSTAVLAQEGAQQNSNNPRAPVCEPEQCKEAFKKLKRMAKYGVRAQMALALFHAEGIGTEKSDKRAFYWTQRAARKGFPVAQFNLAKMFAQGIGVKANSDKADYWFEKAERSGFIEELNRQRALYNTLLAQEQQQAVRTAAEVDSSVEKTAVVSEPAERRSDRNEDVVTLAHTESDAVISVTSERVQMENFVEYIEILDDYASVGSRLPGVLCKAEFGCSAIRADDSLGNFVLSSIFLSRQFGEPRPGPARANCDKICRAEKALLGL